MIKKFKDINDFIVGRSRVMILGVCFTLSPVLIEAASDDFSWKVSDVDIQEETKITTSSFDTINFELSLNEDKWHTILDELSCYHDDWDGEGAKAIQQDSIENCKKLLDVASDYSDYLDDIFPTELGSICIQWYNEDSRALVNVEISRDRMAFYADAPGKELTGLQPEMLCEGSIEKLIEALAILS